MTDLYLITGFLGAGKTTFLKNRLGTTRPGPARRTGVLVNDFGKVNFDGLQLRQDNLDLLELSNGSIFCSCLKEDFIDGLAALLRRGLDEVLIESSGLADPSEMDRILALVREKALNVPFRYRGTVCLVDAAHFLAALPKMLCIERQVRHSHAIIINKCDLADPAQLKQIRAALSELNPQSRIIEAVQGQADLDAIGCDAFPIASEPTTNSITTRNKNLILHFTRDPGQAELRAFLEALGDQYYRIKGLVRTDGQIQQIDLVNRQIRLTPRPEPVRATAAFAGGAPAGKPGSAPASIPEAVPGGINQLVCLTARGLESISHLARTADRLLPGSFRLEL